jgi:glycosyltransferase involved in cell wall biosynthesis
MRIAVVAPVYPPYAGGMGTVAAEQVTWLKQHGVDVTVFTPDYGRIPNPEVSYIKPWLSFGNAALVPGLLKALNNFDLVHLHYPFFGGAMFVWLWSKLKRRPYVLTFHMRPKAKDWREIVFRLHQWLFEPLILRSAHRVLVSSKDYAQAQKLNLSNLTVMPFGVNLDRFKPGEPQAFRQLFQIPETALVYIFVGGLDMAHNFKGVEVLLKAAADLDRQSEWCLVIVGDGDRRRVYENLCSSLNLTSRVIFTGKLSADDLVLAYQSANVHVLPSVNQGEAYGLVTLEAAACGLPSVVSDLPGVRTLVVNHHTGFIVPPQDASALSLVLTMFLLDADLAKVMGQRALERVRQQFNQQQLLTELQRLYSECLSV